MKIISSKKVKNLDELKSFASRKGFIFQSSEIYGGFAAVYDYGHYGAILKDKIRDAWVKSMISRSDIKYLDSAIFADPRVWEASGHVESFDDPQFDCKSCNSRFRADHVLEEFGIDADKAPLAEINEHLNELKSQEKIKCQKCGGKDFTDAKSFNLLVKSNLGSPTSEEIREEDIVYLRGETCQSIYLNFKNYLKSMRVKPPFGIAQVGKAFRNEIVARQYTFRTREFEQMEMQYFSPAEMTAELYEQWKETRMAWVKEVLGLPEESLGFFDHAKLAHYAAAATDIKYKFNAFGCEFDEVEGIHNRGDWDLSRHQEFSGKDMQYTDPQTGEKYIPHVTETSAGLGRYTLAVLDNSITIEELEDGSERTVLKLPHHLAPVNYAIMPLTKDEKLMEIVEEIKNSLIASGNMVEMDISGSIGKRYRRQDEIGTPRCITVDFDTLQDNCVTVRDRDTMEQERVKIEDIS